MTPEALAALQARAYTHMPPWSAADFAEVVAHPLSHLETHDHGFLLARIVADEAEILSLAVDPGAQRRGIASALLDRLETVARARGVVMIHLEVAAANAPARAFYANRGFRESGLRRGYYRRPGGGQDDAVLMQKPLTQGQAS